MDPPEWVLVKVEGWVGVEGREEGRYVWLPVVSPGWECTLIWCKLTLLSLFMHSHYHTFYALGIFFFPKKWFK